MKCRPLNGIEGAMVCTSCCALYSISLTTFHIQSVENFKPKLKWFLKWFFIPNFFIELPPSFLSWTDALTLLLLLFNFSASTGDAAVAAAAAFCSLCFLSDGMGETTATLDGVV